MQSRWKRAPAAVSFNARVERAKSRTPKSFSKALTVLLTAVGSISSERAAPTKLFCSTARTKMVIAWMVVRIRDNRLFSIAAIFAVM